METDDWYFETIRDLVMRHSPSGEEHEVDALLRTQFRSLGVEPQQDESGNLIVKIPGRGGGRLAITAHKDEIGAIVTDIGEDGRVKVRKLGGAFPWVYGEGVVDILGDKGCVSGILSFGSRHVSHASPQFAHKETAPLKWADAWIETKQSRETLRAAGIRPGARMVVGRHRKAPFRLGNHIASYTLDNKASLAILLDLAAHVREPIPDLYLVASSKEEVGALGSLYFSQRHDVDALVALEIAPIAPEYTIVDGVAPVLLAEDGRAIYDVGLNAVIREIANAENIPLQVAVISGFASDASTAIKHGHVARAACLGFPTLNTHGFEIAHLTALSNCAGILKALCQKAVVGLEGAIAVKPTSSV